jgi:hypothetical protein
MSAAAPTEKLNAELTPHPGFESSFRTLIGFCESVCMKTSLEVNAVLTPPNERHLESGQNRIGGRGDFVH